MPDTTEPTDKITDDSLYEGDNKALVAKISENTLRKRSREWIRNMIQNIPEFIEGIDMREFAGFSKGRPAVCCAAGPSLAKQLPLLKKLQKYVTIICVNTAYEPLIKAGITPDVTICIESKNVSAMFKGLPRKGIFMRSAESGPELKDLGFPHDVLWCNSTGVYSNWMRFRMQESMAIDGGGSVACAALSLAFTMMPTKIILIGQDLAYTGQQAYSKGSRYQKDEGDNKSVHFDFEHGLIFTARKVGINERSDTYDAGRMGCVMAWHPDHTERKSCSVCNGDGDDHCPGCAGAGYKCEYTSESFAFFLNWFLSAAEVIENTSPGFPLINATEGGAYIAGFNHQRLKAALRGVQRKALRKSYKHKVPRLKTRSGMRDAYIREFADMMVALKGHDILWSLKHLPLFKLYTNVVHGKVKGDQIIRDEDITEEMEGKLEEAREEFIELLGDTLKALSK